MCQMFSFYIKILLSVHAVALREGGSGLEGERKRGGVKSFFYLLPLRLRLCAEGLTTSFVMTNYSLEKYRLKI